MRDIRSLVLATTLALLSQTASFGSAPRLIDSFDTGAGWKVLPGGDPASLFVSGRYRLQGAKALGVRLAAGAARKAYIMRDLAGDIAGDTRLSLTVHVPTEGLSLSLILVTGSDAQRRYISRPADLVAGWQRVDFPLNKEVFHLESKPGLRTRPADLANLKAVGFLIHNPSGLAAELYFDALVVQRLTPVKPVAAADEKNVPDTVSVGDVVEVSVKLAGDYAGSDVAGVFSTPSGDELRIWAFKGGEPDWRSVRMRASEAGEYSYFLEISAEGGVVTTPVRRFAAVAPPGAPQARDILADPWRIIGLNVAWADDYSPYLRALATNGCNTIRIWLAPWGLNLEERLGEYSEPVARRIDGIMAEAARLGVGVILTLVTSGEFAAGAWDKNPYNRRNGGPCATPEEFVTDETSLRLFQRRALYCLHRWGAYPSLAMLEPAGDLDLLPAPDDRTRIAWLRRVAGSIEAERLYSTGSGASSSRIVVGLSALPSEHLARGLASVSAVGAVGVHSLSASADAAAFFHAAAALSKRIGKPVFVEEFSGIWRSSSDPADPGGAALRASLWLGCAVTGSTPMPWWWDSHIMGRNLFGLFKDLSLFQAARGVHATEVVSGDLLDGGKFAGRVGPDSAFVVAFRPEALTGADGKDKPLSGNLRIRGVVPGRYRLDLWDVSGGKPAGGGVVEADKNGIPVALPQIPVCAIRLIPDTESVPRIDLAQPENKPETSP